MVVACEEKPGLLARRQLACSSSLPNQLQPTARNRPVEEALLRRTGRRSRRCPGASTVRLVRFHVGLARGPSRGSTGSDLPEKGRGRPNRVSATISLAACSRRSARSSAWYSSRPSSRRAFGRSTANGRRTTTYAAPWPESAESGSTRPRADRPLHSGSAHSASRTRGSSPPRRALSTTARPVPLSSNSSARSSTRALKTAPRATRGGRLATVDRAA